MLQKRAYHLHLCCVLAFTFAFFLFGCSASPQTPDWDALQSLHTVHVDIRTSRYYVIIDEVSSEVPMGKYNLVVVHNDNFNTLQRLLLANQHQKVVLSPINLDVDDPAYQGKNWSVSSKESDYYLLPHIRQELSPKLMRSLKSDAILWISTTYSLYEDNPNDKSGHLVNLQISVTAELYDSSGHMIWKNTESYFSGGNVVFGTWKTTSPSGNSQQMDINDDLIQETNRSIIEILLDNTQQSLHKAIKSAPIMIQ